MNAKDLSRQLGALEGDIGCQAHPHADDELRDDHDGPLDHGIGADSMPDTGKQEQRQGQDQPGFDAHRNNGAAKPRREKHQPGKPDANGQQAADDRE